MGKKKEIQTPVVMNDDAIGVRQDGREQVIGPVAPLPWFTDRDLSPNIRLSCCFALGVLLPLSFLGRASVRVRLTSDSETRVSWGLDQVYLRVGVTVFSQNGVQQIKLSGYLLDDN
jgi:hypothetical protein